jgi:hypothetical protein
MFVSIKVTVYTDETRAYTEIALNRKANLTKVHELCLKEHAKGSRDFSLSTIGRLIEADGILKGRALYNAQSAGYRALIEAWSASAGPP